MDKTIISEGRTTNEAIENGLKQLKVSKDKVEIKVLESEEKRSFFSILAPRVVKVEMKIKEEKNEKKEIKTKKIVELSTEEQEKAEENVKKFMEEIIKELPEDTTYHIHKNETGLNIEILNKNLGFLIGYRGETLYAFQNILSAIAGKGIDKDGMERLKKYIPENMPTEKILGKVKLLMLQLWKRPSIFIPTTPDKA